MTEVAVLVLLRRTGVQERVQTLLFKGGRCFQSDPKRWEEELDTSNKTTVAGVPMRDPRLLGIHAEALVVGRLLGAQLLASLRRIDFRSTGMKQKKQSTGLLPLSG